MESGLGNVQPAVGIEHDATRIPELARHDADLSGRRDPEDLTDLAAVRDEISGMAARACGWLEKRQLLARTVTVKVRYDDFTTVTRSHSAAPTRDARAIRARALQLLGRTEAGTRPVRLLGVSVHNFCGDAELTGPGDLPFE